MQNEMECGDRSPIFYVVDNKRGVVGARGYEPHCRRQGIPVPSRARDSVSVPRLDIFTVLLIGSVAAASLAPATGAFASFIGGGTGLVIALLFFLHGARLSREAVWTGLKHWRLHVAVLACSFVLFPLLSFPLGSLRSAIPTDLYLGLIFLCCLPSTVQSSVAFVSMARGNVPAAVCAASLSNLSGVFITPLLVGLLLAEQAGVSIGAIQSLVTQLLLPFVAGQIMRRWIGGFVQRNRGLVNLIDRGSILLIVYSAFSRAVREGFWAQTDVRDLLIVLLTVVALLGIVLALIKFAAPRLGFGKEDEIAILFCGSQKSLVTGIPMANVIFASATAGAITLPLMLYHQLQLLVSAVIARRYPERSAENEDPPACVSPSASS